MTQQTTSIRPKLATVSTTPVHATPREDATRDGSKRRRLAIVSAYGEMCGIAAYAHHLRGYLSQRFDIDVLPLNQTLLRSDLPRRIAMGNRHVDDIARRIREYDAVNIQYEPGTLAPIPGLAYKRLNKLVDASQTVSITFHTFKAVDRFPFWPTVKNAARFRLRRMIADLMEWRRDKCIGGKVFRMIQRRQRRAHVAAIVHTRREAEHLRLEWGIERLFDHPLSFLTDEDVKAAHRSASRADFPSLSELPPNVKLIGVFGFISPYKGTTTAIRALRYLPDNYHLAIFGGMHPASIQINKEIDPYMQSVIEEVCGGEAPRQFVATADDGETAAQPALLPPRNAATKSNISDRVHFMGALDDEAFIKGMCLCHSTVFPYLEVGQTSSGPISMAIELGCRVVAARNHAFMQLAKYHPGRFDFFEIGNHCELAERVLHPQSQPGASSAYSYRSNIEVYAEANTPATVAATGQV